MIDLEQKTTFYGHNFSDMACAVNQLWDLLHDVAMTEDEQKAIRIGISSITVNMEWLMHGIEVPEYEYTQEDYDELDRIAKEAEEQHEAKVKKESLH